MGIKEGFFLPQSMAHGLDPGDDSQRAGNHLDSDPGRYHHRGPLGVVGYFFAYVAVNKYQAEIKQKLAERKALRKEKIRKKRAEKPRKIRNIIHKDASRRKRQG
ncbi:MAG: hypothetical protein U5L09_17900 [Bacteroidales bacterium]|nr:hypothetical protein [Bacteroidales bacterium]